MRIVVASHPGGGSALFVPVFCCYDDRIPEQIADIACANPADVGPRLIAVGVQRSGNARRLHLLECD
jgi:hypothetical protein